MLENHFILDITLVWDNFRQAKGCKGEPFAGTRLDVFPKLRRKVIQSIFWCGNAKADGEIKDGFGRAVVVDNARGDQRRIAVSCLLEGCKLDCKVRIIAHFKEYISALISTAPYLLVPKITVVL